MFFDKSVTTEFKDKKHKLLIALLSASSVRRPRLPILLKVSFTMSVLAGLSIKVVSETRGLRWWHVDKQKQLSKYW